MSHVGDHAAHRAQHARGRRHEHRPDLHLAHQRGAVHRPRTPEGDEREQGGDADRVCPLRIRDVQQPQPRNEARDRSTGGGFVRIQGPTGSGSPNLRLRLGQAKRLNRRQSGQPSSQ